jgi:hypothetical protein
MVTIELIAEHQAAHAVMRWLCGLPATRLVCGANGGLCNATCSKFNTADILAVILAGVTWEHSCRRVRINWRTTKFQDVDEALRMLERFPRLRLAFPRSGDGEAKTLTPHRAVESWMEVVGYELRPHSDQIRDLGRLLAERKTLSARTVGAIFREYNKRNRAKGRVIVRAPWPQKGRLQYRVLYF